MATSTHDLETGVYDIAVSGRLDVDAVGVLRAAVAKALSEQPLAILLDLDGVDVPDELPLLILPTMERRAVADHGLHLRWYLGAGHPQRALVQHAAGRDLAVYADRPAALAAGLADSANCRRAHTRISPDRSAPTTARELVEDMCDRWEIGHVCDDARIIVSELASNAVMHTRGDFDLVLLHRPPFLHVQVLDNDPGLPLFPVRGADGPDGWPTSVQVGGWGLQLVQSIAAGCGVVVRPHGKLVWATLRTRPVMGSADRRAAAPPAP